MRTRRLVLREIGRFLLTGLFAACLIGAGAFLVANNDAQTQAIQHAEDITTVLAKGVVQPVLTSGVMNSRVTRVSTLDQLVANRVLNADIVRVKIWQPDGTILYSDQHNLIGSKFELGPNQQASLRSGVADADVSDLTEPENRYEARFGKLLEVYLPITVGGKTFLFETYQKYSAITQYQQQVWSSLVPVLVGGLGLLFLVQIPLAASLARRLSAVNSDREHLMRRAMSASERERKRIARDLHDGVVQNLMAVATSLSATGRRMEKAGSDAATLAPINSAADAVRHAMGDLRTLIVEIAPPALTPDGMDDAIAELLDPLRDRGVTTDVHVAKNLKLSPELADLMFRVTQEAVRNAGKHAEAKSVVIRMVQSDGHLRLEVEDDGKGFSDADRERRRSEGHVGLSLLHDLVADAGGTVRVDSEPGRGTLVTVEVPN